MRWCRSSSWGPAPGMPCTPSTWQSTKLGWTAPSSRGQAMWWVCPGCAAGLVAGWNDLQAGLVHIRYLPRPTGDTVYIRQSCERLLAAWHGVQGVPYCRNCTHQKMAHLQHDLHYAPGSPTPSPLCPRTALNWKGGYECKPAALAHRLLPTCVLLADPCTRALRCAAVLLGGAGAHPAGAGVHGTAEFVRSSPESR